MHYELWEFRRRSLIGTYSSETEALAMVRELLALGWSSQDLALGVAGAQRKGGAESLREPLTGDAIELRAQLGCDIAERSA